MKKTIIMPVSFVERLQRDIARLARLSAKLNLEPLPEVLVDWKSKTERSRKRVLNEEFEGAHGGTETKQEVTNEMIEVVSVELTIPDIGEVKAQGGWRMLGSLTRTDAGLEPSAFRAVDLPVIQRYQKDEKMCCEHCGANRRRTVTLIIRDEAGKQMQVGRECAHHYLTDAAQCISALEFKEVIFDLIPMMREEWDNEEWLGGAGGRVLCAWDVEDALEVICALVRKYGFGKSRIENKYGELVVNEVATWRMAIFLLRRPEPNPKECPASHQEWLRGNPEVQDTEKALTLIAWVQDLKLEAKDDGSDNFLFNLQSIVKTGFVSERKIALLAALPGAKDRWDREQKRMAMEAARSDPAPEGRQMVEGEVINVKTIEGDWGVVVKMLVQLDNGCRVYCSVPSAMIVPAKGERVKFTATFSRSETDQFFAFGSRPVLPSDKPAKKARKAKPVTLAEEPVLAVSGLSADEPF